MASRYLPSENEDIEKADEFLRVVFQADFNRTRRMIRDGVYIHSTYSLYRPMVPNQKGHRQIRRTDIHGFNRCWDGWSALHMSCLHQDTRIFEHLIRANINLDLQTVTGRTCLHMTIGKGSCVTMEMARILIESKAKLDLQDEDGWTPLHLAVHIDRPAAVSMLLRAGARPNIYSMRGMTPLHMAISANNIPQICTLVKYGANLYLPCKLDPNPLLLSRQPLTRMVLVSFGYNNMSHIRRWWIGMDQTNLYPEIEDFFKMRLYNAPTLLELSRRAIRQNLIERCPNGQLGAAVGSLELPACLTSLLNMDDHFITDGTSYLPKRPQPLD